MAFDPAYTLAQLLTPETDPDEVLTFLITQLGQGPDGGFPVTDWISDGIVLTVLNEDAQQFANTNTVIGQIAAGGYITLAQGNGMLAAGQQPSNQTWLDLLAFSVYQITRFDPVFGTYNVQLTCPSGFGPYTIAPNGLWGTDPTGTFLYNSTNALPVVLASSSTVTLTFQAQNPGVVYNVIAPGGTTLTLTTPLLGVTAATLTPTGATNAALIPGADGESDANLIQRCVTKWASLATTSPVGETWINYARNASSSVTGVYVQDNNPDGPATIRIYISTASGTASPSIVTTVNTALQPRVALGSFLTTLSAVADPLAIAGVVYGPAAQITAIQAAVNTALIAYQASLAVGDGVNAGAVWLSVLESVIQTAGASVGLNVRNVDLTSPTSDHTPVAGFIVVLTSTLTFVGV